MISSKPAEIQERTALISLRFECWVYENLAEMIGLSTGRCSPVSGSALFYYSFKLEDICREQSISN